METLSPEELAIYKFEPDNIIMIHKATRALYQYFQTPIIAAKQRNLFHNNLLQASFLPTGIIYKKGVTSIHTETSKRMKNPNKQFYQQQELVNTFSPILSCLQYLHSKGLVHGSICPQNIIFNDQGEVLLRDWLLQISNNKYYEVEKIRDRTTNDDIAALGVILLEASQLSEVKTDGKGQQSYQNLLKKLTQRYSRGYILAIYVMLKKMEKFYPHLDKILKNNQSYIDSSEQLVSIFKKIKGQKELKSVINAALLNHSNYKFLDLLCKTPLTTKKVQKIQDVENKKNYGEQTRRKNFERSHKITQKNTNNFNLNNFSNIELLKKPDMALKKMSNMKFNNIQQQQTEKTFKRQKKQDVLKFASPLKRLKTVSKKKAF